MKPCKMNSFKLVSVSCSVSLMLVTIVAQQNGGNERDENNKLYWGDGVVVRASALQSLDMGLIP